MKKANKEYTIKKQLKLLIKDLKLSAKARDFNGRGFIYEELIIIRINDMLKGMEQ